jgi:hypothetical protein
MSFVPIGQIRSMRVPHNIHQKAMVKVGVLPARVCSEEKKNPSILYPVRQWRQQALATTAEEFVILLVFRPTAFSTYYVLLADFIKLFVDEQKTMSYLTMIYRLKNEVKAIASAYNDEVASVVFTKWMVLKMTQKKYGLLDLECLAVKIPPSEDELKAELSKTLSFRSRLQ